MNRSRYLLPTAALISLLFLLGAEPSVAQPPPDGPDLSGGVLGKSAGPEKLPVSVDAQFTAPAGGKPGRLFVTARIDPDWHIYSTTQPTSEKGNPTVTKIVVNKLPGVRLLADHFTPNVAPQRKTEPDAYEDLLIETHVGTVTWYVPLELASGVDPATLKITGTFSYGTCNESTKTCLLPQDVPFTAAIGKGVVVPEDVVVRSASATAVAAPPPANGKRIAAALPPARAEPTAAVFDPQVFLAQIVSAFIGGLILNLMPCVLPVIGLKVLAFVQQAGESRGRIFMLNVWYSIGLIAVFLVLAALATFFGLAWGEQFTDNTFKITMTALVFVMALSFLGVWEIPIPGFVGSGRANDLQNEEGPIGAFCKGVFTTILATPCSGPFLGPVFGYVSKQPPHVAYGIFGAIGLGMASPYLLIGAFPALIRFLPKPGAWMDTFKQLMGFFLLATVVYLIGLLKPVYVIPTLAFLVGLWFACWWIGRTPLTAPTRRTVAWCGGGIVATLVGALAFTVLMEPPKIPWKPFSPEAVARARADNKTVMVDFTANWCPNCKTNSKIAIERDAVLQLVKANGVEPLLADWSDKSPALKTALHELGYNSIPLLVIWPADPDSQPIVLTDLLTESKVLDALRKAGPSRNEPHHRAGP